MNKTSDKDVGHVMAKTKSERWFVDAERDFYRFSLLRRKWKLKVSTRWRSASSKALTLIHPRTHPRGRSSHHSGSRSRKSNVFKQSFGRTVASCPCEGNQTPIANAWKSAYRKSSGGTGGTEDYSRSPSDMKGRWSQFPGCREGHPARTHEKMIKFSLRSRSSVWKSGRARCSQSSDRAERRHENAILFSRIRRAKFCGGRSGI